jgi:hypothetical protein
MPVGEKFEVEMSFDRTTTGGQNLFLTPKAQASDAGARNLYTTKNAFTEKPKRVKVTVEVIEV